MKINYTEREIERVCQMAAVIGAVDGGKHEISEYVDVAEDIVCEVLKRAGRNEETTSAADLLRVECHAAGCKAEAMRDEMLCSEHFEI